MGRVIAKKEEKSNEENKIKLVDWENLQEWIKRIKKRITQNNKNTIKF